MSEETKSRVELRNLIDLYAYLGDEKKIAEQMQLFTKEANYTVFMGGVEVASTTGTDILEKEFNGHAAAVKTYFTLNGQQSVDIDGEKASGISFTQIKMVRENEGKIMITDYSVKYEDDYVRQDGKWLINKRIGHFLIVEERELGN